MALITHCLLLDDVKFYWFQQFWINGNESIRNVLYIYQTHITKRDPSWVGHNLLGFSNPVVVSPPVPTAPMVLVWEPELPRVLPRRMPARVSFTCSTETLSNCTPYTLTNEWVLGQNWLANGPPPYYSNVPIRFYESIHSPQKANRYKFLVFSPTGWP